MTNANNFFNHIERSVHIGLRKVELVQDTLSNGKSFYFKINDLPIYAKGANLIPFNEWSTNVTEEQMRWTLESAAAANMNMIRVWGGGRYLPDIFYKMADEMGIMIW